MLQQRWMPVLFGAIRNMRSYAYTMVKQRGVGRADVDDTMIELEKCFRDIQEDMRFLCSRRTYRGILARSLSQFLASKPPPELTALTPFHIARYLR